MADLTRCEFGHDTHATRFSHGWWIWDWERYRDLPPGYCPGRDDVSMSIELYGEWEADETAVVLSVVRPGDLVVDFGSHIGWYAVQAAERGADVLAFDADSENMRLLARNAEERGVAGRIGGKTGWLTPGARSLAARPTRLVKADVEGAEDVAIEIVRPSLDAGLIDYLLIECSPEFADYYPALIDDLIARGYTARTVGKEATESVTGATLGSRQRNVWFSRA